MEQRRKRRPLRHQKAKTLAGILLIAFGGLFLAKRLGAEIPHWIVSWEMALIAIGTVTLYKHYWQKMFGYVLITIGGVFMLNDFIPGSIDKGLIFPLLIIVFGVLTLAKSNIFFKKKKSNNTNVIFDDITDLSSDDFIDSATYFGGIKKNVVSKTFKGGDFTTAFGGTEVILTKADMEAPVFINSLTAFGELKLIVPSNWKVNSDITCMFGAVEDERSTHLQIDEDQTRIVNLTGTCFMGGVKIISY